MMVDQQSQLNLTQASYFRMLSIGERTPNEIGGIKLIILLIQHFIQYRLQPQQHHDERSEGQLEFRCQQHRWKCIAYQGLYIPIIAKSSGKRRQAWKHHESIILQIQFLYIVYKFNGGDSALNFNTTQIMNSTQPIIPLMHQSIIQTKGMDCKTLLETSSQDYNTYRKSNQYCANQEIVVPATHFNNNIVFPQEYSLKQKKQLQQIAIAPTSPKEEGTLILGGTQKLRKNSPSQLQFATQKKRQRKLITLQQQQAQQFVPNYQLTGSRRPSSIVGGTHKNEETEQKLLKPLDKTEEKQIPKDPLLSIRVTKFSHTPSHDAPAISFLKETSQESVLQKAHLSRLVTRKPAVYEDASLVSILRPPSRIKGTISKTNQTFLRVAKKDIIELRQHYEAVAQLSKQRADQLNTDKDKMRVTQNSQDEGIGTTFLDSSMADGSSHFVLPQLFGGSQSVSNKGNNDLSHMNLSYISSNKLIKMSNNTKFIHQRNNSLADQTSTLKRPDQLASLKGSPRSKSTMMNFKNTKPVRAQNQDIFSFLLFPLHQEPPYPESPMKKGSISLQQSPSSSRIMRGSVLQTIQQQQQPILQQLQIVPSTQYMPTLAHKPSKNLFKQVSATTIPIIFKQKFLTKIKTVLQDSAKLKFSIKIILIHQITIILKKYSIYSYIIEQ